VKILGPRRKGSTSRRTARGSARSWKSWRSRVPVRNSARFAGCAGGCRRVGYPVLVRPSYVLGGRAMEICYEDDGLREYMVKAVNVSRITCADRPFPRRRV